jgi:hypothetical protein
MKKALKAKWVAALRSGKFTQGTGEMRSTNSDGGYSYCCLGVLCAISPAVAKYVPGYWTENGVLGPTACAYAGFDEDVQWELAGRNDTGNSFKRIATYIEKHL